VTTRPEDKINLYVTPLKRSDVPQHNAWLWDVTAEETLSGKRQALGRITSTTSVASHTAKELATRERPELTVLAVIVEPTIGLES